MILDLTGITRPWTLSVLNQIVQGDVNEILIKDRIRNFRNTEVNIYKARVVANDENFYTQLNHYFETLGMPTVRIGEVNTVYAVRRGIRAVSVSAFIYALMKYKQPVIFKDTLNEIIAMETVKVSFKDCKYEHGAFICKPMYA